MNDEALRPARPLWDGIYDFAWRSANTKSFISCSLCLIILAGCACGIYHLSQNMEDIKKDSLAIMGAARIFAGLAFLALLFSIFPSACFMRIIESTAAGEEEVRWSQGVWFDFLKDFVFLVWILFCSAAIPAMGLCIAHSIEPLPLVHWCMFLVIGTVLLQPLFLLSTMMGNAAWMLIHPRVLQRFLQQPMVPAILYLNTVFFGIPCIVLGYWMMVDHPFLFPFFTGIVWATYWMTHARLLGRVGWILTEDAPSGHARKKR
jgi:hypothetical protein